MSTNLHQKRGKQDKGSDLAEKVVVAVKASKEIPKTALVWALTHVVQPGDCITLLVVVPAQSSGRKLWGFPRFAGDCASGHRRSLAGTTSEQKCDITDCCSQMMLQLHDVYDPNKINIKIKVISGSPSGAVAAESKRAQANWVVLDKHLKQEEKRCMEELQCNIVVMKRSQPKVLRLNLVGSPKTEPEMPCPLPPELEEASDKRIKDCSDTLNSIRGPAVTPTSSPELGTPFTPTEAGTSSVSSSDPGTSPFFISESNGGLKKEESQSTKAHRNSDATSSDSDSENLNSPSKSLNFNPWMAEILSVGHTSLKHSDESFQRHNDTVQTSTTKALLEKFSKLDREAGIGVRNYRADLDLSGNVRQAISLSRNAPPGPPLCSICQHKAPVFGKPPRWFSYAELELATGGFSQANFLAEGGFGSVHRGVLPDGQAVAVKQHKLASSQGDLEFCSEVEVLSCAQHRNVVMLIGFCVEDRRRLLVYEYICNGSLDSHLYGRNQDPLTWSARQNAEEVAESSSMASINNYYQNHLPLLHFLSSPSPSPSSSSPNCLLHLQNPNLSSYSNLILLKIPKRLRLSQSINSKIRNRTFRCSSQQPIPQTGQKSTTDESDRPRFDLNLAVVLAGFAFEAYLNPPKDAGKREVDAADCHTVFLSELFLREVYDGQLFIKLKRGFDLPQMDPWGTSDPYVVIQLDGQVAKSKVKWATKKPVWNEDLTINVKKRPAKYLQVAVWDANLVAPHKRMGNAGISLEPICDGNLHEVLVELEGMGGGGKIQLEVQYKNFDEIDKEKQWWKIPFVSQFLMNNEFASALKMAFGSENVKARQFVQSAFGQLRSFNYTYLQKGRYPNGDSSDVEGSTKSLNSLGDFSNQFLQQERTPEGSVDDSSGSTENNFVEPDTDSDVRGKESNSLVERTVDDSMQSDEQFWKNLAAVINQTVAQKLDFPVNEKIKWDSFELLKRMGSQSRRMAEAWYVESGLATPNHKDEKTKFSLPSNLPSTLNEIQSSLADIKTTLPDIKSASLDLLSKTDAILGSFMVLTAAVSQQTEEAHSVVKNESKKDASSMGDGITGYSSNETVDANPEGSVLDERKAEEMKALFSTAESAMEAWAVLATSLGRPSFIKSEFEKICFLDNISTDTQVALWRDSLQKRLVVAFRGTEQVKWKDLRTDLMLAPAGLNPERIGGDFKEEVQVHSGFLSAYDSVRNRIMSLIELSIGFVEDGVDDMPKWHVYVTGHSLGGALATLLALELLSSQMAKYGAISVTMYNFGSPRVGNKRFAELYNEKVKDSWRIVNHRDIIPTVPRLMGYCHVAQPVYLAAGDFRDALFQANMEFSGDGYEGDLIGEYTPDVLVNEFLKGEKELIEKILHAEINLFRSLRDGTGLMQHMEDFYYITLLESVRLNYRTVDNSNANESDILSA